MTPPALYVVWPIRETHAVLVVGRLLELADGSGDYEYVYTEGSRVAERLGFTGFLAFPELDRIYRCSDLPPFFSNRVMSRRRPDYAAYVHELALEEATATPVSILTRSAGRRQTDPYEVFAEAVKSADGLHREGWFMVRGIRYVPDAESTIAALVAGQSLRVEAQLDNPVNPKALQLFGDGPSPVGWVPDYLVDELAWARRADPSTTVTVVRVNRHQHPADTASCVVGRLVWRSLHTSIRRANRDRRRLAPWMRQVPKDNVSTPTRLTVVGRGGSRKRLFTWRGFGWWFPPVGWTWCWRDA